VGLTLMRRLFLGLALMASAALPALAQNFGNIAPNTVIGNRDPTASKPAAPIPFSVITPSVTPMQYGAVGDGVADDTAAVQAAINAASHGTLLLGPHLYAINSTGLTCSNTMKITGNQPGDAGSDPLRSGFVALSTNMTLLKLASGCIGSLFEDLYIKMDRAGMNTSGWAIQTNTSGNVTFQRVQIDGACNGIDMSGFYWLISQMTILNAKGGSGCIGMRIGHATVASATTGAIYDSNIFSVNTTDRIGIGMLFEDMGGTKIAGNDVNFSTNGTVIKPGVNQAIFNAFFHDTVLGDTVQGSAFVIDTATGGQAIQGIQCNGCWAATSANGSGIEIKNTAGLPATAIAGINFVGARVMNNGQNGVLISAGSDIDFESSHICGNNVTAGSFAGISLGTGVSRVRIRGGAIGGTCGGRTTTQTVGVTLFSNNTNIVVAGVDLSQGNTSPISTGAGVSARIEGNPGYNPLGPQGVGATASPMTYTAGNTAESVCLTGGTVSGVTVGGVTVASATNACTALGPHQAMVITYSAAPTITALRQ
jgi:hypothetical protein